MHKEITNSGMKKAKTIKLSWINTKKTQAKDGINIQEKQIKNRNRKN